MTVFDFARELRATPVAKLRTNRFMIRDSVRAIARREKIQIASLPINVGSNRMIGEVDNHLFLDGYTGNPKKDKPRPKTELSLPHLDHECCCFVHFFRGQLIQAEPDFDNPEARAWFDAWEDVTKPTGFVRVVKCHLNLQYDTKDLGVDDKRWDELGKPAVWMTSTIEGAVLTELFDETQTRVGMALVYSYQSLCRRDVSYRLTRNVLLPSGVCV